MKGCFARTIRVFRFSLAGHLPTADRAHRVQELLSVPSARRIGAVFAVELRRREAARQADRGGDQAPLYAALAARARTREFRRRAALERLRNRLDPAVGR